MFDILALLLSECKLIPISHANFFSGGYADIVRRGGLLKLIQWVASTSKWLRHMDLSCIDVGHCSSFSTLEAAILRTLAGGTQHVTVRGPEQELPNRLARMQIDPTVRV